MLTYSGKYLASNVLRQDVLNMAKVGNSVHIGCAFSMIELFAVLYEKFVRFDINDLYHPERDLVCLSKGHGVMAIYACLLELSVLDKYHTDHYFSEGSLLKGLSDSHVPGIEVTGGSLGHGITVSVGYALAIKFKKQDRKVFCFVGDGEMNEGSVWESLLFAAHWKLKNFILVIDANDFQAMGRAKDVLNSEPFKGKLESFNFETWECDGHSRSEVESIYEKAVRSEDERPKAIIARTVKGKGISFMEDDNVWHYTRLVDETYALASAELKGKT
ncbi:transketolase [Leptospira ognonensis]|uniref:Transketolase n=1 Tax=Leptospira ognonensis TaxID=2484945 RepID=A0A4R9JZW5_9LEPT|nr:transketolase [Leptospira ognonensis]TGL57198.1 transketolase [Leptospira ognonensis]